MQGREVKHVDMGGLFADLLAQSNCTRGHMVHVFTQVIYII